ncbi:GNAT family N-acetyltransferase [Streptomyces albipurpureus]|uniref:GNAT family N-acetyltransferase n=1 Tax=Streptomyces albipurpureus TaxID=2897419 RepID=A0ABT0UGA3_9ACTN|nr:GNAT family N-acetyltransferase [Streptomyces sp. CWNU-1]MCM2387652.1 GNAT family N-acetyltransferase [Streptomyces sp. CWNU-1]
MSGDRIEVLHPAELTAEALGAWRELRATAGSPDNPFMAPEFTRAVGLVRPGTRVAVQYQGGEQAGFFPFERGLWGRGRAVGMGVSDCQGAILRPGLELDPQRLLRACSLSVWEFDNLETGQNAFIAPGAEGFAAPVIDVADGYPHYEGLLRERSRKFLKSTLAQARRMDRQVGPLRFVFDERDPAVLETLMAWKSAQYRRTGRRDRFAQKWIAHLVRTLADTEAPDCSGVLSVLYAADLPVAAHFGLRSRTVLSCWFPAYDVCFAKFSPGLVLHLRMVEAAAAAGIGLIDLGRGEAGYKDSLKTRELTVHEGALTRPGAGAALHRLSREPVRAAHRFVTDRPRLASFAARTLKTVGSMRYR